jgi:hypothetical protein
VLRVWQVSSEAAIRELSAERPMVSRHLPEGVGPLLSFPDDVPNDGLSPIADTQRPKAEKSAWQSCYSVYCSGNSVVDLISDNATVELISCTPGSLLSWSKKNRS